jgi:hypothetical protein
MTMLLSRRLWLWVGVVVAGFVALCTLRPVSLFPFRVGDGRLGYAVAGVQLYVAPPRGLVANRKPDWASNVVEEAFSLADQMASPEVRDLIGSDAGIPPNQIAVDGPLDLNESIYTLMPDGEKRASQVVVQDAPYRITIDEDTALPEILVQAQAPTTAEAVRLAGAAQNAAQAYLSRVERRSDTPGVVKLTVYPLGPITVSNHARSGQTNLAVLTFLLAFVLWAGLVSVILAVVRDIRTVRRGWTPRRVSP